MFRVRGGVIFAYQVLLVLSLKISAVAAFHHVHHQRRLSSLSGSQIIATSKECWGKVEIDYSAANEYIDIHYGEKSPRKPYFSYDTKNETIWDARNGLVNEPSCSKQDVATLQACGFVLVSNDDIPINEKIGGVDDWMNLTQIQDRYLPQLTNTLKELYKESQRTIRQLIFWNPMLRGQDMEQIRLPKETGITPTASFAASPHIDMDVNAYDSLGDFLDLIENNEISATRQNDDYTRKRRKEIIKDIEQKDSGFAIVNAWCNIGHFPVHEDPLGLFSVKYNDSLLAFPEAAPDMQQSQWYVFSDMIPGEILFFCQYDRDVAWPSDLWHCGLRTKAATLASRQSFDIRCFIVFDERVAEVRDRHKRKDRVSSLLTLEESGCFCEDQFERRNSVQEQ